MLHSELFAPWLVMAPAVAALTGWGARSLLVLINIALEARQDLFSHEQRLYYKGKMDRNERIGILDVDEAAEQ